MVTWSLALANQKELQRHRLPFAKAYGCSANACNCLRENEFAKKNCLFATMKTVCESFATFYEPWRIPKFVTFGSIRPWPYLIERRMLANVANLEFRQDS